MFHLSCNINFKTWNYTVQEKQQSHYRTKNKHQCYANKKLHIMHMQCKLIRTAEINVSVPYRCQLVQLFHSEFRISSSDIFKKNCLNVGILSHDVESKRLIEISYDKENCAFWYSTVFFNIGPDTYLFDFITVVLGPNGWFKESSQSSKEHMF